MHRRSHRLLPALTLLLAFACHRPAAAPGPADAAVARATCKQTSSCSQACPAEALEKCVAGCAARLAENARPFWEALQSCSKAHCTTACASPTALSCKLCVMSNCAAAATSCLSN